MPSAGSSASRGLTEPPINSADAGVEIVGVVHDTLNRGLTDALLPEIYIPYSLLGAANRVVVQTAGDPAAVTRAVVERVYAIDRDQPVTEVQDDRGVPRRVHLRRSALQCGAAVGVRGAWG